MPRGGRGKIAGTQGCKPIAYVLKISAKIPANSLEARINIGLVI